jgi:hypothetical protein
MTLHDLSFGSPGRRAAETVIGELGVVGAGFIQTGDLAAEHGLVERLP